VYCVESIRTICAVFYLSCVAVFAGVVRFIESQEVTLY